jgi:predicted esterase YcpF (UPF0227 family)
MAFVLYLHGFNSAPQSAKAQQTVAYFAAHHPAIPVMVPALQVSPAEAMRRIRALLAQTGRDCLGVIGSSLGGFYALHLQAELGLRVVLVNPAVRPYDRLQEYLGENTNWYTGERYRVKAQHMDELRALSRPTAASPHLIYLLTQTGDATLDHREALTSLAGARLWVQAGGSHAFEDFPAALPSIADFLLCLQQGCQ